MRNREVEVLQLVMEYVAYMEYSRLLLLELNDIFRPFNRLCMRLQSLANHVKNLLSCYVVYFVIEMAPLCYARIINFGSYRT